MASTFLFIIFSAIIFLGIFMVFVPMLPALLFMFVMATIFAVISGFATITFGQLAILFGIFVLSVLSDSLSGILGAVWSGASRRAIIFGILGALLGFILLPPLGGLVGIFVGVLVAELWQGKSEKRALKAATGSLIGTVAGMLINLILAISFFVLFLVFVLA